MAKSTAPLGVSRGAIRRVLQNISRQNQIRWLSFYLERERQNIRG